MIAHPGWDEAASSGGSGVQHTNHCAMSNPGGPFGGASSREGKVAASNYFREEEESGKLM